jgi:hypothetical protein
MGSVLVLTAIAAVAACSSSTSNNNNAAADASFCTDTMDTEQAAIDAEFDPDGSNVVNCAATYEKQLEANWCAISGKTGFVRAGTCADFLVYELDFDTTHHTRCFYDSHHNLSGIVYANNSPDKCAGNVEEWCNISVFTTNQSCTPVVDSGASDSASD